MSEYKPKVGDRVRVVLEGEVARVSEAYGGYFQVGRDHEVWLTNNDALVSIEKVEPPVVTFKPGDVVREKDRSRGTAPISLGRDGFINHSDGAFLRYGQSGFYLRLDQFTSERFEKVEL